MWTILEILVPFHSVFFLFFFTFFKNSTLLILATNKSSFFISFVSKYEKSKSVTGPQTGGPVSLKFLVLKYISAEFSVIIIHVNGRDYRF